MLAPYPGASGIVQPGVSRPRNSGREMRREAPSFVPPGCTYTAFPGGGGKRSPLTPRGCGGGGEETVLPPGRRAPAGRGKGTRFPSASLLNPPLRIPSPPGADKRGARSGRSLPKVGNDLPQEQVELPTGTHRRALSSRPGCKGTGPAGRGSAGVPMRIPAPPTPFGKGAGGAEKHGGG